MEQANADDQPIGWQVIDPDGNVVDSGPCIELEMAATVGDPKEA